jgi:predicted ATPase
MTRQEPEEERFSSPPRLAGSRWQVALLGGLQARNGDVLITHFGSRAIALLFARLTLQPRTEHARERLAEWLWPEVRPRQGRQGEDAAVIRRTRLRRALSVLGGLLDLPGQGQAPWIVARRETLRLNGDLFETDVARFEELVRRGQADAARACYRGELMPGFDDDWIEDERARLAGLLNRIELAGPDVAEGEQETRALVPYVTTFFGRERELAELAEAVRVHRLVVVTGPGGCGKTRLCGRAADGLPGFELVVFVGLADCEAAAQIGDRVRAALNLQPGSVPPLQQVAARLSGLHVLLLLDNVEQLVGAETDAVLAQLLDALPGLHLLLSSRRSLQDGTAHHLPLGPLPMPPHEASLSLAYANPCVALFVDRARAARADFRLHARNLGGVVAACRLLEGLPLAIEIAASRVRQHSPHDIGTAVTRTLGALARRGPTARRNLRHASLEAALDWSWRLLEPGDQQALASLTVLRANWTATQAAAVIGDDGPMRLRRLGADSLVHTRVDAGGEHRYAMLDTVREFVADRIPLEALADARRRHAAHFREQAQATGREHGVAAKADLPNFVAALRHALAEDELAVAVAIALGLGPHTSATGAEPELLDALRRVADAAPAHTPGLGRLHALLPRLLINAGYATEARQRAAAALAAAGPAASAQAEALWAHTLVQWLAERDSAAALAPAQRALALAREAAMAETEARALLLLGAVSLTLPQPLLPEAAGSFEAAERLVRRLGDRRGSLHALPGRTACLMAEARWSEAQAVAAAGEKQAQELGDVATQLQLCSRLATCQEALRHFGDALHTSQRQVRQARAHGMAYHVAYGLWNQGRPLARLRRPDDAALLMAYSSRYWVEQFGPLNAADTRSVARVRRLVATQVGVARLEALWSQGLALAETEALRLGGA